MRDFGCLEVAAPGGGRREQRARLTRVTEGVPRWLRLAGHSRARSYFSATNVP